MGKKELDEQDYVEWNRTVHGFMRLWDIAEVLGITACLTQHLDELPHSDMAACLAQKGNCRETYLRLFMLSLRALLAVGPDAVGPLSEPIREEQILSLLGTALVRVDSPGRPPLPEYSEPSGLLSSLMRSGRP